MGGGLWDFCPAGRGRPGEGGHCWGWGQFLEELGAGGMLEAGGGGKLVVV